MAVVVRGGDQAAPEVVLPDPVDHDPRGERMLRIGQPARQREAAARRRGQRVDPQRDASQHGQERGPDDPVLGIARDRRGRRDRADVGDDESRRQVARLVLVELRQLALQSDSVRGSRP